MSEIKVKGLQPVKLMVSADKKVLNPVLEPCAKACLKVSCIMDDGSCMDIDDRYIEYICKTKYSSAGMDAAELDGSMIFAKEGGISTVTASAIINGIMFEASTDIVVRPFYRDYHQMLVLKLFMGQNGPIENGKNCSILCNFEDTLEVIRKIDFLTRGIPKLVYLVGWQQGGHDWLYPDWSAVNDLLKRPHDETALDSLKWLIKESKRYNTDVSLHINMLDAYEDSPLWKEYIEKDLIARNEDGSIAVKWEYEGRKCYHISYTREWSEGLAQRRIDALCEMLPEIRDSHSIHIDAFHSMWQNKPISPWHEKPENGGISIEDEVKTQCEIFKYFRKKGFDVTSEGVYHERPDGFIGLQPMAWWFDGMRELQMRIPEYLYGRGRTDRQGEGDFRFGESMHGEDIIINDKENLTGFLGKFCRTTLPWYYLSRLERKEIKDEMLYYNHDVTAGIEDGKRIIRKGGFILREEDDLFVPALWNEQSHKEIIAYSKSGYSGKKWRLPREWSYVSEVDTYFIDKNGLIPHQKSIPVSSLSIVLSLSADKALSIVPSGTAV